MIDFETPREASLRADNARLTAENTYLRQAAEYSGMRVTPIGAVDTMELSSLPPMLNLPIVANIHGGLSRYGRYHVLAKLRYARAEDLEIAYYAPGDEIKSYADYAVNQLLPYMHEQFVRSLAKALA